MPSTPVQQFLNDLSTRAQQLGIQSILVAVRDPITKESIVVSSAGATDDLRAAVEIKLGGGGDTSWE